MDLQEQLAKKTTLIEAKKREVIDDLSRVEPAVEEAAQAVKGIKKQQLAEVRTLKTPPPAVKLALECVCTVLGHRDTDWADIRKLMSSDTFIGSIVNFDSSELKPETRKLVVQKFISNEEFTYEKVDRASKACGPMVKWAIAQVQYSDMLDKVEPLRLELARLEEDTLTTKSRADEVNGLVQELERSIAAYRRSTRC